jgi:hypothetical protein
LSRPAQHPSRAYKANAKAVACPNAAAIGILVIWPDAPYLELTVNNRKEVIPCLIVMKCGLLLP